MLLGLLKDILRGYISIPKNRTSGKRVAPDSSKSPIPPPRKVLNVGGNSKDIPIPSQYHGWQHVLLDIDASGNPDVVCDARELIQLAASQYDAVYCSHNLEHYYRHDVAKVLAGFRHVLRDDGFVHVRVPNIGELMRQVVNGGMDINDVLYNSPAGPIHVNDFIYGYGVEIERTGNDFFAHKTGFTQKSLLAHLRASGFLSVTSWTDDLDIVAVAFTGLPTTFATELFHFHE